MLEGKLKQFNEAMEVVEGEMQQKNSDIANLTQANSKLTKQVEELRMMYQKQKKQEEREQAELIAKQRDRDAEIEVLKEMIKGVKVQLKSKDTDIQRLLIKIKRLEKTNEIRDTVMN